MMSRGLSRRAVLAGASALAAALGPRGRARAAGRRRLRILQWNHFVPGYDRWFDAWARSWGERNDTDVTVDHVGVNALNSTAAAEVSARRGHDLVMFLRPRPVHEPDVIDHREIVEECQRRYGKPLDLALRSTRTGKFHGFCDSVVPDPVNYRSDLWAEAGQTPDDWDRVRLGGKAIKARSGIPVGIGLSAEDDSAIALRVLLLSFGGSEQDASGAPALGSKQTLEAVRYVTALYREAMTPAVLAWDPSSNNRAMIAGQSSLVMNAISITGRRRTTGSQSRRRSPSPAHRRDRPGASGFPMRPVSTSSGSSRRTSTEPGRSWWTWWASRARRSRPASPTTSPRSPIG